MVSYDALQTIMGTFQSIITLPIANVMNKCVALTFLSSLKEPTV